MKYNKLLQRQIHKYFGNNPQEEPALLDFLHSISDSYDSYERDTQLSNRAFSLSELEYKRLNDQLQAEIRQREFSIKKLKEAVAEISDSYVESGTNDLADILQHLKKEIHKKETAQQDLLSANMRFSTLLQNSNAAVMVEDENGIVLLTNQDYCDLVCPGKTPSVIIGQKSADTKEKFKRLTKYPDRFEAGIVQNQLKKRLVTNEIIELTDGRMLERDFIPVIINQQHRGQLWKYRDVTAEKQSQRAIAESETRLRLLLNSALDAIIHIDVHGKIIFWNPQATTIFGWKKDEAYGQLMSTLIIPPRYREHHERGLKNYLTTGDGVVLNKNIEITAVNKQGNEFPVELTIIAIRQHNETIFCSFIRDISVRKEVEAALKASEEMMQFAIEGAGDGIWDFNFNTKKVFHSSGNRKMLGFPEETTDFNWQSYIHPDDKAIISSLERDYADGRITSHKLEYRIRHRLGHYIWIMDRGQLIGKDSNGLPGRLVGTHTDITLMKEKENELRRLSLVAKNSKNGIVFTKTDGTIFWANERFENLTGYTRAEIIGSTPILLLKGDQTDNNAVKQMLQQFYSASDFEVEITCYRKDKSVFWAKAKGYPVFDKDHTVIEYFTIIEDITTAKNREDRLRILSKIAEDNINAVVISDENSCINWVNKSYMQMTGYTMVEIIGKKPSELLHGPETAGDALSTLRDKIYRKRPFNAELINYRKNGEKYWVRIKGQPFRDNDGKLQGYFALLEDITREKEAEKQIREFETRFRKALERVGDNAWEHNFNTGKTYFSNTSQLFINLTNGQSGSVAHAWWSHIHPDDLGIVVNNDSLYKAGKIDHHALEYRMIGADGIMHWVLDRGVVIERDENYLPIRIAGTHTDITNRKQAEQSLRVNEEKYRSIIANMNLGLLEVNLDEEILFANQSFCDMSGYSIDELTGKKAAGLFVRGETLEKADYKNEQRKKGISDVYEISVQNKNGDFKWWLISGAPRYDDNGKLVGSIGIHLDITQQKQLELDLMEAREAAEQSAEAKEMFLANMSHEIRTPMNAIMGMSRELNRTKLNKEQSFYLDNISKSAEHLLVLINDILDISKIEAGKLNLENIGFRLCDTIKHSLLVMEHKAEEKGLKLILESCPGMDTILLGDPYRLNQILLNLISNALKFTEQGSVTITVLLQPENDGNIVLGLSVKDTGIGMEQEYLDNIFRKFTQEDKSTARKYGGTGLGMSICKQLTELMDGRIDIHSSKGTGTTVMLTIPFALGTITDLPDTNLPAADSSMLKGKRVLLVEDNEMNRLVASMLLHNYEVITDEALNGIEAIQAMKKQTYDLVLMDMQMPVMNGLDATAIIRQEIDTHIPIIALTANAIKGESDKCIQAGMNDYVSKPFEEEHLINTMIKWLQKTE